MTDLIVSFITDYVLTEFKNTKCTMYYKLLEAFFKVIINSEAVISGITHHLRMCLLSSLTQMNTGRLICGLGLWHASRAQLWSAFLKPCAHSWSTSLPQTYSYSFTDASDSCRNTNTSRVHHFRIHNAIASSAAHIRHFRRGRRARA